MTELNNLKSDIGVEITRLAALLKEAKGIRKNLDNAIAPTLGELFADKGKYISWQKKSINIRDKPHIETLTINIKDGVFLDRLGKKMLSEYFIEYWIDDEKPVKTVRFTQVTKFRK